MQVSEMVYQAEKSTESEYIHAITYEREAQKTYGWRQWKGVFQSKFRPLTFVTKTFLATLGSAQTRGLSLYSSGAPLPVSSEIVMQKSDTV